MRKLLLFAILLALLNLSFAFAALSCSIVDIASCQPDNTVLRIEGTSNSNAGLWNTNFGQKAICCTAASGHTCQGNNVVLRLAEQINSHVEKKTLANYQYNACFGSNDFTCSYKASCSANEQCLASISADTNAHVGDCSKFPQKICCGCAPSETSCTDGMDNDCDGLIDCADTDCTGSINGNVKNTADENIESAKVEALQDTNLKGFDFTDALGNYDITSLLCGTYNLIASAPGYLSRTRENVYLPPKTALTVNFNYESETMNNALILASTCEADCTYAGDNTIHKECADINGCLFYKVSGDDTIAKQVCDLAQPGWERDYDADNVIVCPSGPLKPKSTAAAQVTCTEENLIKITKVVVYNGEPVNMVITVCG